MQNYSRQISLLHVIIALIVIVACEKKAPAPQAPTQAATDGGSVDGNDGSDGSDGQQEIPRPVEEYSIFIYSAVLGGIKKVSISDADGNELIKSCGPVEQNKELECGKVQLSNTDIKVNWELDNCAKVSYMLNYSESSTKKIVIEFSCLD
ncbi:MAG: hypothetical protein KBD78_07300 [Oligoflexales bacterium]|nr:hypothetical protein [Oligoflexales bacterium]